MDKDFDSIAADHLMRQNCQQAAENRGVNHLYSTSISPSRQHHDIGNHPVLPHPATILVHCPNACFDQRFQAAFNQSNPATSLGLRLARKVTRLHGGEAK
jgi:hypothetical protein